MHNYNINTKINMFDSVDRMFDKSKSVFKDWKDDNKKNIKRGFGLFLYVGFCQLVMLSECFQPKLNKSHQEMAYPPGST